jgi:ComF family protein
LWRLATSLLGEAGDALASVFLPAPCRICEGLLVRASRVPLCDDCLASFAPVPERACEVCDQPLESFGSEANQGLVCTNCSPRTYAFTRARSSYIYRTQLVHALLLLKYHKMEPLAEWFAVRMVDRVEQLKEQFSAPRAGQQLGGEQPAGQVEEELGFDLVVPVPLHPSRERERGYNQAALLAKPLARRLRLPYKPILLVRTRPRPEKRVLSLEERWEAVRGAFATRPGSQVDKQRVLLVDDVLTTGATLDACARALLDSGAKSVVGLTVARAARSPVTTHRQS